MKAGPTSAGPTLSAREWELVQEFHREGVVLVRTESDGESHMGVIIQGGTCEGCLRGRPQTLRQRDGQGPFLCGDCLSDRAPVEALIWLDKILDKDSRVPNTVNEVNPALSTYRQFVLMPTPKAAWWQKLLCFIGLHSMRVVNKMYVGQFYVKCGRPGCVKDSVWEP